MNIKKNKDTGPIFQPQQSITSNNPLKNKLMEMRALAGAMEKLRYKVSMRRIRATNKVPFRVLSPEPYRARDVVDFEFRTGSKLTGRYGPLGIDGFSKFVYPDGAVYTGEIWGNKYVGEGVIRFPHGGEYSAFWVQGVAFNPRYVFPDGLRYEPNNWGYCMMSDRRFFTEYKRGLNPSGNIQLSNDHPAPALPVGSYDSGEGYFNPFSREMIHPITGDFMRIPSQSERRWILNHCRREWITPLPFNPTIYENWFPKYNKEISVKTKPVWQVINKCIGERSGIARKIETLTGLKPNLINTSKEDLIEIHNVMNKNYDPLKKKKN